MTEKPTHLQEVPAGAGAATFQEMAAETDRAVFGMMVELRANYPGLGGAIVSGAAGGLARYQMQGMPDGATGQQVLEVLAPVIRDAAQQISNAARARKGLPAPKVPPVNPMKTAFDKLTAALSDAQIPTWCIWTEGRLLLLSAVVCSDGVLTHGTVVLAADAMKDPAAQIHQHIQTALRVWHPEG